MSPHTSEELTVNEIETGLAVNKFTSNLLRTIRIAGRMKKEILINIEPLETRVAVLDEGKLDNFHIERQDDNRIVGSIFKGKISEPVITRLRVQGPGIITAQDIDLPKNIELVDPSQYIASLGSRTSLEMEILIEPGYSYLVSEQVISRLPQGFLAVDAVFMPVRKVNFFVETSQNKAFSTIESLILEISTNGSITPQDAIFESSQLIINLFSELLENKVENQVNQDEVEIKEISNDTHMNISIEELQLSVRAYNCLKRAQINSISDLLKYSPEKLQEIKNFGQKSADEVFDALKNKLGITLT